MGGELSDYFQTLGFTVTAVCGGDLRCQVFMFLDVDRQLEEKCTLRHEHLVVNTP